jgi:hypothetical protein
MVQVTSTLKCWTGVHASQNLRPVFPGLCLFKDREFHKTQNLILESAALLGFPKLKIRFSFIPGP